MKEYYGNYCEILVSTNKTSLLAALRESLVYRITCSNLQQSNLNDHNALQTESTTSACINSVKYPSVSRKSANPNKKYQNLVITIECNNRIQKKNR